jgi:hypothetical protein
MRGHDNMGLGANGIFAAPQAGHGLLLGVELQAGLAVEGVRAAAGDTLLVTGEREHGQGDGDGDVDADLAGFNVLLEARGGRAGASEDGGSVAVLVLVDEFNGVVQRGDVEADEDGAEDFLLVASHIRGHVGDDSWADLRGQ